MPKRQRSQGAKGSEMKVQGTTSIHEKGQRARQNRSKPLEASRGAEDISDDTTQRSRRNRKGQRTDDNDDALGTKRRRTREKLRTDMQESQEQDAAQENTRPETNPMNRAVSSTPLAANALLNRLEFKKRTRQPSLLQLAHMETGSDSLSNDDLEEFLPNDQSTPLAQTSGETSDLRKSTSEPELPSYRLLTPESQIASDIMASPQSSSPARAPSVHNPEPSGRRPLQPLKTASIQNLLPRRQARAHKLYSDDVELDATHLGDDQDELSFQLNKTRRRQRERSVAESITPISARKKSCDMDSKTQAEMSRLAAKFREVDDYALDFEDMTSNSSQMQDAR